MKENVVKQNSWAFALRVVKLAKHLLGVAVLTRR
jgi:hypothetical protein